MIDEQGADAEQVSGDSPGEFDPPSRYQLMCVAVGRLFLMWARLENTLAAGLRLHLISRFEQGDEEAKDQAARTACAIYGSMRLKAAKDTIKRIATEEAFGDDALGFMSSLFEHVGHIESFRDKIAHQILRRVDDDELAWTVTDIVTTRKLSSVKMYEFETEAIMAAAHDLQTAANRIDGFLTTRGEAPFNLVPIEWHYKQASLKLRPTKDKEAPQPEAPQPAHPE